MSNGELSLLRRATLGVPPVLTSANTFPNKELTGSSPARHGRLARKPAPNLTRTSPSLSTPNQPPSLSPHHHPIYPGPKLHGSHPSPSTPPRCRERKARDLHLLRRCATRQHTNLLSPRTPTRPSSLCLCLLRRHEILVPGRACRPSHTTQPHETKYCREPASIPKAACIVSPVSNSGSRTRTPSSSPQIDSGARNGGI